MARFCIQIAGRTAQVVSLFESTRDYCRKYLTEETPDFTIRISREDLAFEQDFAFREAREEGLRPRVFTDPFLDRAAIQRRMAEHLLQYDTLLLHGSAVAVDGEGFLFTAKCGTGKSTHTRLWMQVFGQRAVMVNDDKPFIRIASDGIWICGAPWSGKHGLDTNITVPLKGICLLERSGENKIQPVSAEEMLPWLLHEGCAPRNPEDLPRYEALVTALARRVPLWHLRCNKAPEAAVTAYTAMK